MELHVFFVFSSSFFTFRVFNVPCCWLFVFTYLWDEKKNFFWWIESHRNSLPWKSCLQTKLCIFIVLVRLGPKSYLYGLFFSSCSFKIVWKPGKGKNSTFNFDIIAIAKSHLNDPPWLKMRSTNFKTCEQNKKKLKFEFFSFSFWCPPRNV